MQYGVNFGMGPIPDWVRNASGLKLRHRTADGAHMFLQGVADNRTTADFMRIGATNGHRRCEVVPARNGWYGIYTT